MATAFQKDAASFDFSRSMMPRELEGLWEGPWPYIGQGVGVMLEGLPTSMMKFEQILCSEGCHPDGVARILARLQQRGFDKLTVQSDLHFRWLHKELAKLDIKMTIIPPLPNWDNSQYPKTTEFPKHLIPDKQEYLDRSEV